MRVGFVIPSFRSDADTALAAATAAEMAGIDGVFVYDHLFPMAQPERPAISSVPLLAAVAAETGRIALGPLVARVGLVPDAVLVNQFKTMARIAPGRLIVGLGTGDEKSRPEHEAYGLAYPPVQARVTAMRDCGRALLDAGIAVWTSGRSAAAKQVARELGVPHNLWAAPAPEVAKAAAEFTVTWAGPPPGDIAADLVALREAGATWAVYAPPPSTNWPEMIEKLAGAMVAAQ